MAKLTATQIENIQKKPNSIFTFYKKGLKNNDQEFLDDLTNYYFFLIQNDPNLINIEDRSGNTLLHFFIKNDLENIAARYLNYDIQFFCDAGEALVNKANKRGISPLLLSLTLQKSNFVKLLLDFNANFYLQRGDQGILLRSQYSFNNYLSLLLSSGQYISEPYLDNVLSRLKAKINVCENAFEIREMIDRTALRLIGLEGEGSEIDLKNWSDMFADETSEVTDVCTLEKCYKSGEQFGLSYNYLVVLTRALIELVIKKNDASTKQELLTAINTAKIDQETSLIQLNNDENTISTLLDAQVAGLNKRINLTGRICYPAGWPGDLNESGHAIYVNVTKRYAHLYRVGVFNLGGGFENSYVNQNLEADGMALPAIASTHTSPLKEYLYGLIWANVKGVDSDSIKECISQIYSANLFGKTVHTVATSGWEIEQLTNNCIVKNYLFSMRDRLGDAKYSELYLSVLNVTLEQINSYCAKLPSKISILKALQKAEAVFSNITLEQISQLPAYKNNFQRCQVKPIADTQPSSSLNQLTRRFGIFNIYEAQESKQSISYSTSTGKDQETYRNRKRTL